MIFRVCLQLGILALLVLFIIAPFSLGQPNGSSPIARAQTAERDQCHGDEVISFAPSNPEVGQEMLVVVTSAQPHRGVYLAASERATTVQESEGQLGHVWLWSLTPRILGPHRFQFFVDFTILCTEATIEVVASTLGSIDPTTGVPISLTPGVTLDPLSPGVFPTLLPLDDNVNGNLNDNDDNDNDDLGNDNDDLGNDNTLTETVAPVSSTAPPTPAPFGNDNTLTETVAPPKAPIVDEINCSDSTTHEITLTGQRFGETRTEFSGLVLFVKNDDSATFKARSYLSWKSKEVVVLVPSDVTDDANYTVYLTTLGGFDKRSLPDDCRH